MTRKRKARAAPLETVCPKSVPDPQLFKRICTTRLFRPPIKQWQNGDDVRCAQSVCHNSTETEQRACERSCQILQHEGPLSAHEKSTCSGALNRSEPDHGRDDSSSLRSIETVPRRHVWDNYPDVPALAVASISNGNNQVTPEPQNFKGGRTAHLDDPRSGPRSICIRTGHIPISSAYSTAQDTRSSLNAFLAFSNLAESDESDSQSSSDDDDQGYIVRDVGNGSFAESFAEDIRHRAQSPTTESTESASTRDAATIHKSAAIVSIELNPEGDLPSVREKPRAADGNSVQGREDQQCSSSIHGPEPVRFYLQEHRSTHDPQVCLAGPSQNGVSLDQSPSGQLPDVHREPADSMGHDSILLVLPGSGFAVPIKRAASLYRGHSKNPAAEVREMGNDYCHPKRKPHAAKADKHRSTKTVIVRSVQLKDSSASDSYANLPDEYGKQYELHDGKSDHCKESSAKGDTSLCEISANRGSRASSTDPQRTSTLSAMYSDEGVYHEEDVYAMVDLLAKDVLKDSTLPLLSCKLSNELAQGQGEALIMHNPYRNKSRGSSARFEDDSGRANSDPETSKSPNSEKQDPVLNMQCLSPRPNGIFETEARCQSEQEPSRCRSRASSAMEATSGIWNLKDAVVSSSTVTRKKRKMTGNKSKHFTVTVVRRSKRVSDLESRRASLQGAQDVVPNDQRTSEEISHDFLLANLSGTSQHHITSIETSVDSVALARGSQDSTVSQEKGDATQRRSVRPKRKTTGKISEHFSTRKKLDLSILDRVDLYNTTTSCRHLPAGTSVCPVPSINEEKFGIIQEKLWREPFWLLVAVIFLNQTTGRAAVPTFWDLKAKYPRVEDLANADQSEVKALIEHLGLQNQRSKRIIQLAKVWIDDPPLISRRHRTLHYPLNGNGKGVKANVILDDDAEHTPGALEIGHLPGCKQYAYDSWRIFCRDVLRGVADDYKGLNARGVNFEPEWQRVLPLDKELRACLRWMWLREGFIWDPLTGFKRAATEEEMIMAVKGDMDIPDEQERSFAHQAVRVSSHSVEDNTADQQMTDDLEVVVAEMCNTNFTEDEIFGLR